MWSRSHRRQHLPGDPAAPRHDPMGSRRSSLANRLHVHSAIAQFAFAPKRNRGVAGTGPTQSDHLFIPEHWSTK
jgi:hypothetical protein